MFSHDWCQRSFDISQLHRFVALSQYSIEAFIMAPIDQRRIVRNPITANACHVSNIAECTSRYGSIKKKKYSLGYRVCCDGDL